MENSFNVEFAFWADLFSPIKHTLWFLCKWIFDEDISSSSSIRFFFSSLWLIPMKLNCVNYYSINEIMIEKFFQKLALLKFIPISFFFKSKVSMKKPRLSRVIFNYPVRGVIHSCHGMSRDLISRNCPLVGINYGRRMWFLSIQPMGNIREIENIMQWFFDMMVEFSREELRSSLFCLFRLCSIYVSRSLANDL